MIQVAVDCGCPHFGDTPKMYARKAQAAFGSLRTTEGVCNIGMGRSICMQCVHHGGVHTFDRRSFACFDPCHNYRSMGDQLMVHNLGMVLIVESPMTAESYQPPKLTA